MKRETNNKGKRSKPRQKKDNHTTIALLQELGISDQSIQIIRLMDFNTNQSFKRAPDLDTETEICFKGTLSKIVTDSKVRKLVETFNYDGDTSLDTVIEIGDISIIRYRHPENFMKIEHTIYAKKVIKDNAPVIKIKNKSNNWYNTSGKINYSTSNYLKPLGVSDIGIKVAKLLNKDTNWIFERHEHLETENEICLIATLSELQSSTREKRLIKEFGKDVNVSSKLITVSNSVRIIRETNKENTNNIDFLVFLKKNNYNNEETLEVPVTIKKDNLNNDNSLDKSFDNKHKCECGNLKGQENIEKICTNCNTPVKLRLTYGDLMNVPVEDKKLFNTNQEYSEPFINRYTCNCGYKKGKLNYAQICERCGSKVMLKTNLEAVKQAERINNNIEKFVSSQTSSNVKLEAHKIDDQSYIKIPDDVKTVIEDDIISLGIPKYIKDIIDKTNKKYIVRYNFETKIYEFSLKEQDTYMILSSYEKEEDLNHIYLGQSKKILKGMELNKIDIHAVKNNKYTVTVVCYTDTKKINSIFIG